MKYPWIASVAVAAALAFGDGNALSREHPQKTQHEKKSVRDSVRGTLPESEAVFTANERMTIGYWYARERSGLPPMPAKQDQLPADLEKQLYRQGSLPPGLKTMVQPLPVVLERQLRFLPTGYRRVVVGGNIILIHERTALICDVVRISIP